MGIHSMYVGLHLIAASNHYDDIVVHALRLKYDQWFKNEHTKKIPT